MSVFTLDPDTTATTLRQLVGLQSRVAAVTLSVLAHGEVVDVAATSVASCTSTWLAAAVNATGPDAHRQARLARSLADPTHGCVREALAAGRVLPAQAKVIIDAVENPAHHR